MNKTSFVDKLDQQKVQQQHSMTACRRTGIKITDHNNTYKEDPFAEANAALFNKQKTANRSIGSSSGKSAASNTYEELDLNLNHYDRGELLKLFGFPPSKASFDADDLKDARKIMLKTHPDKSGLKMDYFLFFSAAYDRLLSLAEFGNTHKPSKPSTHENEAQQHALELEALKQRRTDIAGRDVEEEAKILDRFFENFGKQDLSVTHPTATKTTGKPKPPSSVTTPAVVVPPEEKSLYKQPSKKDTRAFNEWFNAVFEKQKLDDDAAAAGYGDWLKSEEDIAYIPDVNKSNMMEKMEQHKRSIQAVVKYNGVEQVYSGNCRGNELMQYDSNFSSGGLFGGDSLMFTDLKQAYVESVIPVTQEDFSRVQQYRNVDEYRRQREEVFVMPSKEDALQQLYEMNKRDVEQSAALAFHLAKQNEQARAKHDKFWSTMKQLQN